MKSPEHEMQVALFRWLSYYPALRCAYAIPNAGQRTLKMASWYKAEGLRAGMPDVCIPIMFWDGTRYGALYIELKTAKGKVSPAQAAIHDALREAGNYVAVCRSLDEARAVIEQCYKPIM